MDSSSAGGSALISMEPVFSEGAVFSSSLCTNTLAQSFYNRDVLPLIGALLSTRLTNFQGRDSVGEVQLLQAEIPEELQVCMLFLYVDVCWIPSLVSRKGPGDISMRYVIGGYGRMICDNFENMHLQNKPYKDLFEAFLCPRPHMEELDMLPLGLYRRHDGMGENYW